jgi:hypothetical protein
MSSSSPSNWISMLSGHAYINLETYRRNGQAVATPVWFTIGDNKIGDVAINSIDALTDLTIKADLKKKFDTILSANAKSRRRDGGSRVYEDLIKGRFNLDTAFHLERQDDPDTISNKWFDLSAHIITKLIGDGRIQALRELLQKEDSSRCSQLDLFMNEVETSLQNQEITQSHADELKRIVNIVKQENRCS